MNRIGAAAGVMLREILRPKRSLRFENREGVKEYDSFSEERGGARASAQC